MFWSKQNYHVRNTRHLCWINSKNQFPITYFFFQGKRQKRQEEKVATSCFIQGKKNHVYQNSENIFIFVRQKCRSGKNVAGFERFIIYLMLFSGSQLSFDNGMGRKNWTTLKFVVVFWSKLLKII